MSDESPQKFYGWFIALGLLVSALVVVGYYKDQFRDWKTYQQKYVQEAALRLKNHPESPPATIIRDLQEALETGIQEQRKLEFEMGFNTK